MKKAVRRLMRMIRPPRFFAARATALAALSALFAQSSYALDVRWPTSWDAFARGLPKEQILQPTASGQPLSGAFGDVRSGGYRFHEGIDIKPERRDKKSEALDDILCVADGKVVMINRVAGNSGYGRYVVVTHPSADVEVYTLYAHLAEISPDISVGAKVKLGARLGKMGRSASYSIARAQAHLHFEIGLRMSDGFDRWYSAQRYRQKNFFGNWNGMNLTGFDPWDFMANAKNGSLSGGISGYIKSLPTAFVARIYTSCTPDFVGIYPELCDLSGTHYGWDIHFTWYGLPKKIERIKNPKKNAREGELEIIKYNPEQLRHKCRRMISVSPAGVAAPTEDFKTLMRKIFP